MTATIDIPATEAAGGGRQFVTFQVRDELFGLPLADVREIIRMPELVEVPLSPPSLEGIANLRGTVLPITSLRRVFGTADAPHDDATRVVVLNRGGQATGFVVDRMSSVITAESEEIESVDSIEASMRGDMLQGVVKRAGRIIMLLDTARLDMGGGKATKGPAKVLQGGIAPEMGGPGAAVADEVQLVSFEAAGQEYAFPIADVQEIVQVPGQITRVPHAGIHVVGVITLRDRLLPLVSLRQLFGLPEAAIDEHSRILVVSPGGHVAASVGIIVDTVREVLRVSRTLADPVPAMFATASNGETSDFEAICRLQGGKRLVTILSAQRMFRGAALQAAIAAAADGEAEQEQTMHANPTAPGADDEEQFVTFRLAGQEYGVPIGAVQEIVRVPADLTRVPKVASFMEGVVNLRGMVLPVVDQRRRFGLSQADRNDRQRIMVLTLNGVRTGFIVDSVTEVLKISAKAIERAPELSDEQSRLIRRVANLEAQKRIILLLDPSDLVDAGEIDTLRTAGATRSGTDHSVDR
jgi:purine-binding chemotaxis protein CheW